MSRQRKTYDSPLRREQAAATRRSILEAAKTLFERDGYTATSMAAIAAKAGVAARTPYLAFETKFGVLRALWHLLLRGDEGDAPVGERDWYRAVLEEPDPRVALRRNAANGRRVREQAGGLLRVISDAAGADPDVRTLWESMQTEFHANQRAVVQAIADRGGLRPGLDVDRAADIVWAINNPSTYLLLVHRRGWTAADVERWQVDALSSQLLAD